MSGTEQSALRPDAAAQRLREIVTRLHTARQQRMALEAEERELHCEIALLLVGVSPGDVVELDRGKGRGLVESAYGDYFTVPAGPGTPVMVCPMARCVVAPLTKSGQPHKSNRVMHQVVRFEAGFPLIPESK